MTNNMQHGKQLNVSASDYIPIVSLKWNRMTARTLRIQIEFAQFGVGERALGDCIWDVIVA